MAIIDLILFLFFKISSFSSANSDVWPSSTCSGAASANLAWSQSSILRSKTSWNVFSFQSNFTTDMGIPISGNPIKKTDQKLINSVAIAIANIRRALPFYSSDSWQPRQFRGLALSRQKYEWKYPKRFCDKQYLEQTLYKRKLDWKYAMTVIWVPTNNTHSHTFCYRHLVKIRYTCWL